MTDDALTRHAVDPGNVDRRQVADPHTYVSARERGGSFAQFQMRPSHLMTNIPGSDLMQGTYVSTKPLLKPTIVRAAALTVCEHARDAAEAADFLTALGLRGAL